MEEVKLLEANPRQVKRFINIFRLLIYIGNERGLFVEMIDPGNPLSKYPRTLGTPFLGNLDKPIFFSFGSEKIGILLGK